MDNRFRNFLSSLKYLILLTLLGIAIFFAARIAFLFSYGNMTELGSNFLEVAKSFAVGLRFDFKILCIVYIPIAILCLLQLLNQNSKIVYGFYYRFSIVYGTIMLFLILFVSVVDFYFYKFYNTRISVIFFGIIEDDTTAVLKSVWTDYPVVILLISMFALAIGIYLLLRILFKREIKWVYVQSPLLRTFIVIIFLGIYFLGLRGSTGMKPLGVRHSTISKNTFINTLTLNGPFSLINAFTDKKESEINTNIAKMLKQYEFKSTQEAVEQYLGRKLVDSISIVDNLMEVTPVDTFLQSHPPHVIFVLMESMNDYYFQLNTPETNVLGKLESVLPSCYVFHNFLSASKGTIYSLEALMVGTPLAPISQSVYQNRTLSSTIAKPFKEKGYTTSFITGGETGWRNLDQFMYKQQFDNIEGGTVLKKLYPNASSCEWGVHDEYTFKRIKEILKSAGGKPQFVVGFTISNHTPYETPSDYSKYPLSLPQELLSKIKVHPELAYNNLMAYQYSNNCLGQFIDDIKNSPLGENTIVVATGDHTNNQLFEFTDKDMLKKYAVPFILYVPEKYKVKNSVDVNRFGSHKDIFPTLFNLSLSNAKYLKTGNNLMSADKSNDFGVYCFTLAMSSKGCVDFQGQKLFYQWVSDSTRIFLSMGSQSNYQLDSLYNKSKAYVASMKFFIMNELASKSIGK